MRSLEIAVVILLVLYLAWRHPRPTWVRLAPATALIATLIHFAVEGYRWQMIPLYALTALLGISALVKLNSAQDWKPLASYLTLILLAISMALPILLPVPNIPEPSGDFPVGTTTLYLTDASRTELYSGKDEPRKFMVQIWYPAVSEQSAKWAPWMSHSEIYAPIIASYLQLPSFFLDHLELTRTPAIENATLAHAAEKFPVIVFSHGWNGFAAQNSGQAMELASHGYVVVGVQHTYGAIVTVLEDGTIVRNNPSALPEGAPDDEYEIAARKLVNQWASDIAFTLDQLTLRNADPNDSFFSALDMDRVGGYGHSTGGGAVVEFCGRDARCKAVLGLDPFMRPVSVEVLERGLSQPAFFMFSQVWADDTDSRNNALFGPFYEKALVPLGVVAIDGTRHYDFTDLPLLSPIAPQLGLKGPISGKEMVSIMNRYLLAFFDETLKGKTTDVFGSSAPQFPEIKFIQ